jgi:hypothetical protein
MDEENIDETIVDKEPITDDIEEEEGSIEKAPPPKRPRSEKQRKAFEKAQAALKAKREKDRELKAASRKPRGRPKKVLPERFATESAQSVESVEVKPKRQRHAGRQTEVFIEDGTSSSDSEPEQIVVKTRRKKKKPKQKKQPQVIYISESDSDEEYAQAEGDYYEDAPAGAPVDPFAGLRFV